MWQRYRCIGYRHARIPSSNFPWRHRCCRTNNQSLWPQCRTSFQRSKDRAASMSRPRWENSTGVTWSDLPWAMASSKHTWRSQVGCGKHILPGKRHSRRFCTRQYQYSAFHHQWNLQNRPCMCSYNFRLCWCMLRCHRIRHFRMHTHHNLEGVATRKVSASLFGATICVIQ